MGRIIRRSVSRAGHPTVSELLSYSTASRDGITYQTTLPIAQEFLGQTLNYGRASDGRLNSYNGATFAVDYRGFVISGMGEQVEYDDAGNITRRTLPNGLSANYSYDNKHRLTGFQLLSSYRTLSYDGDSLFPSSLNAQGQITSFTYYGAGALRSFTRGGVTYTFSYDGEGRCWQRVGTDGSVRLFHYEGGRLEFESVPGSWYAHYFYGDDGRPEFVDIFQNNTASRYFFRVDVYGTILKLLDYQGTVVVSYQYGLFGELTRSGTMPVPLSLAYKGYRYDSEAGLYILGCRAYDPCFGRFLSPDSPQYADFSSPGGLSLYCYCYNNPVNYADRTGHLAEWAFLLIGIGIGAVIGAGTNAVGQYISNGYSWDNFNWGSFAWSAVIGGASGALAMSTIGATAMIFANAGLSAIGSAGSHLIAGDDFGAWQTWLDIGVSGIFGGIAGALSGAGAMHSSNINAIRESAGVLKASASYFGVLDKIANGGYATLKGAHIALSITRNRLVSAWNGAYGMIVGRALSASLFYSAWTSAENMLFSSYWYPSLLGV